MRPVSLKLKGFTSFKNEAIVPFANLDRFAICGPTGAGKSSLLDALTFALFAHAPRVGAGSLTELISCRSKSFSVVLDFRVRDQVFRVGRIRRQNGTGTDQFEKVTANGEVELVAQGTADVTRNVETLLGLKYEHFTQAVFLPQGKFAEFLKVKPAERRRLLNELLRLLVFGRMQERANQERETFARQKEQTEKRLDEDFVGVSADAGAKLERLMAEQQEVLKAADELLPGLQKQRDRLCRGRELTVKLEEKNRQLNHRREQEPGMNERRAELAAASGALPVVPSLDYADACNQEVAARRKELDEASISQKRRKAEYTKAEENLKKVNESAAELPHLKEKEANLAEIVGRIPQRDQLTDRVAKQKQRQKKLVVEHERSVETATKLAADVIFFEESLEKAKARLVALDYDATRHRHLEAVRGTAIQLQHEQVLLADALKRVGEDEKEAENAESAAGRAEKISTEAEQQKQGACDRQEQAMQSLTAAENAHRAAHLRSSLQLKQPCPVCGKKVTELPLDEPVPELEHRRRAAEAAKRDYARVEKTAAQKATDLAGAKATAASARQKADAGRSHVARRQANLMKQRKGLEKNVKDLLDRAVGEHAEDRILNAFRHSMELAGKEREESERVNALDRDLAMKKQAKESQDTEMSQLEEQMKELAESLTTDEKTLENLGQEIRSVAGSDDPVTERTRLQRELKRIEREAKEASDTEREARTCLLLADDKLATCNRETAAAQRKAKQAMEKAAHALEEGGFTDAALARSAFRGPDQLEALQRLISNHETETRALEAAVAEIERELNDKTEEATGAQREYDACLGRKEQADKQISLFRHRIDEMTKQLARAEVLRQELLEQSQQHTTYRQLAQDLRSDNFQAFILEETLVGLINDAAIHLGRLTGDRYALAFEDDRIIVIDNDNAGEQRGVDTLSGGETFQASLALALALSEQVQKAVGAVHLDCLFIDEGFGTLDPETLRTVSDAIRGLQVGGRMVGIITHVPELRDEFEQRIIVRKDGASSTAQVEVA